MNRSVQIVIQVTEIFKNRCLIVLLSKLIVDVVELDAL